MNLRVKYSAVLVKQPESVRDFLTGALGFEFRQNVSLAGEPEGIIVCIKNAAENCLFLIEDTTNQNDSALNNLTRIIINTDDCLKDYHHLTTMGIKFIKEPRYTALGLAADIIDEAGNQYTLLEERNYLDN